MTERTICQIDEKQLIGSIQAARSRLVFAAPGVTVPVAQALGDRWKDLGRDAVSVILDADAEVCRLGYGTLEGLETLQQTATQLGGLVCHQPGLRIGLLVSDQTTLIYTPTPLLIENDSGGQDHPNGILLTQPPEGLASELGLGPDAAAARRVGLDKVPDDKVKQLAEDLRANPPLAFDIARPVLVFNSQVEFVEFNLEKIQLQRQEIPIPPDLMGLTAKNIHGLFRLEVGPDLLAAKDGLEKKKREIDREFIHPMRGFGGSIIRRSRKAQFLEAVERLRADLEVLRHTVRHQFEAVAGTNKASLVRDLVGAVQHNPPPSCPAELTRPGAEDRLRQWLFAQLSGAFDKVARVADDMRVTVRFKGVTYECLKNPEFIERATAAFPDLQLHEEYAAARGKPEDQQQASLFG